MRKEFDTLATALFGMYWGPPLIEADVLERERVVALKGGDEPTLEEQRALVNLAFERRAAISDAVRAVQGNVLKCLGVEA